ncbi:MAG: RnfABCDGE type electron transport complex subunit D [Planctomycetes bacterium]|nr:RnfABCDGE type electron transport complex subunit D [Planctomycetota bacterium]
MAQTVKKNTFVRKQPAMRRVLLGLTPCVAGAVYYFGWRSLAAVVFCCAVGFLYEWLFCRWRKEPVSEAVFVTAVLFALVMPPGVGWHVMAAGMAFAVLFSKEMFGGYAKNIFNPAIAGRCFVYICFPVALTGVWYPPAQEAAGALTRWSTMTTADGISAKTSATPMAHVKAGRIELVDSSDPLAVSVIPIKMSEDERIKISRWEFWKTLFLGRLSGTMGVTSAGLILLGGIYLYITKTASRTIILTMVITYALLSELFYQLGVKPVLPGLSAVLGGGFLLGAFFMATDPVSSPRTEQAKIAYAIIICISTVVIRNFSIFNGGLMFSILIGNMFAPIFDYAVKEYWPKKKPAVVPLKGAA